jgi:hypothetical protein
MEKNKRSSFQSATCSSNNMDKDPNTLMLKRILEYLDSMQNFYKNMNLSPSKAIMQLPLRASTAVNLNQEPPEEKRKLSNHLESFLINTDLFLFDIDAVGLFINYFPHNNVEKVLKTVFAKRSRNKNRHMSRKFMSKSKYKKDKDECFSP